MFTNKSLAGSNCYVFQLARRGEALGGVNVISLLMAKANILLMYVLSSCKEKKRRRDNEAWLSCKATWSKGTAIFLFILVTVDNFSGIFCYIFLFVFWRKLWPSSLYDLDRFISFELRWSLFHFPARFSSKIARKNKRKKILIPSGTFISSICIFKSVSILISKLGVVHKPLFIFGGSWGGLRNVWGKKRGRRSEEERDFRRGGGRIGKEKV